MKTRIELIEWGVLMECTKPTGEDYSTITYPVSPQIKESAEVLLATELEKNPRLGIERTTETGILIKPLRLVKKITDIKYE